ncbi:MAG: bifunctional demethylmenaquinone methyltransferase/2-methoxy-6-polyprenyl-1,4-benzoquinol methylase UbiE [Clostridium sp.]|nr:bifunctional demethylmenaquinone methyltransferase/2-methoxy-6-polyprenyl-1,4-benzoquinol methylase UbiE [Prevotella sp.]MCM1428975.1 bifunctional demethylmenaquinone methyltransferase/2-methoxy-6-polyprenyl-1,4-benzoquinol methylase UbiE [Clostridium sp.]MCM1476246.1 bifunctional demethylmenaquinone methyltransferase/2-methoxy-6-polyprenyl-1,4-benzoquinol methylase UbiE [Muribaculaceae bacterium]
MAEEMVERPAEAGKPVGAERIMPYSADEPKGRQVETMFDSIAPAYDFMNGAMTFGLHRTWRRSTLNRVFNTPQMRRALSDSSKPLILDVATGTGDFAIAMAKRLSNLGLKAGITGVDLSEGMLEVARRKSAKLDADTASMLEFESGNCLNLKFDDDIFSLITVAYGVRNFERLSAGLKEMCRVLRPGGILCILELSTPVNPLCLLGYKIYTKYLIPMVGRMVSGDSRAYTYLPQSIAAAPQRGAMTAMMEEAGLNECTFRSMTMGVVTIYIGSKPYPENES